MVCDYVITFRLVINFNAISNGIKHSEIKSLPVLP
jgi:hypothetical protein